MHSDQHYLMPLFEPRSVAIVGASEKADSIGTIVLRNMMDSGYDGQLFCVNPGHKQIFGLPAYKSMKDLPQRVDVAVICTRADKAPLVVEACGKAGTRAVIVVSAGFAETGPQGAQLEQATLEAARRHNMRLLGPNCLGLIRPCRNINLSFARNGAIAGTVGLISQSGALCTAILDWAQPNKVGFSSVISLGAESDVDFGEALDYLVSDPRTEHIFLYIEGIRNPRRFMSALRAAARVKPVLLIKVGRHPAGERAALSHTGALVGDDDVFDAVVRRSGVVRLHTIGQLYGTASALFFHFRPRGNRLAIITNGGGPGAMAADHAADIGIPLAQLAPSTLEKLDAVLPTIWPRSNPIDIIGDAGPDRYGAALEACLKDDGVDGILLLLTPQAMSDPTQAARTVIDLARGQHKPIFTCWMGEEQMREARLLFRGAGIPTFNTPEPAVDMFSHISGYYRSQQLLMQTPSSMVEEHAPPDLESARLIIETALQEGRDTLNEMESKALLATFHIPIARTIIARSAAEAMALAEEIGLPVAMKIDARDITQKEKAGGVRLNLHTLAAVRNAYQDILEEVAKRNPAAMIRGVSVEPMVIMPHGRELSVGMFRDKIFGPAITLGPGGSGVEPRRERVVALPPLNDFLVTDMLATERIARRLGHYRNLPPVHGEALKAVLLRISEMVCELPWIQEVDINPLIVDDHEAIALDARIVIAPLPAAAGPYDHMAIHPYPSHLTTAFTARNGECVTLRPIRPEDAEMEQHFVQSLSAESRYFRFLNTIRELSPTQLIRLTQIDYDREMAFLAVTQNPDGSEHEVGVARYVTNPDGESCEFAIVVADDWQGSGVATRLMQVLIETARSRGLRFMTGEFLSENTHMLKFVAKFGFQLSHHPEDPGLRCGILPLADPGLKP